MRIAFTDRELDVMMVLWDLGPATVAEVRAKLRDKLAYTTVLTVLRTLEDKRYVKHEQEGRAYRYHPTVARSVAGTSALKRMLDTVFGGSAELLLTNLVTNQKLSRREIGKMRRLLEDLKPARGTR